MADPLRERGELDLLALDDGETSTFSDLEEEESVTHLSSNAHHDLVGFVEDVVHEGLSPFSDSVLLTQSTMGVESVKVMALSEHGEITVRWKRSRGTPWA